VLKSRFHLILFTLWFLHESFFSYELSGGQIIVNVELVPALKSDLPEASVVPERPESIVVKKSGDRWEYRFSKPNELYHVLLFRLSSTPKNYWYKDIALLIPFFIEQKVFDVTLAATKIEIGADEVRNLYATKIQSMRPGRLFVFYNRARFVATERISRISDQFDDVSDFDIQAAFKFLESARELSYGNYLQPDKTVYTTRDWLQEALEKNIKVVKRAVGIEQTKQLVSQIDELEGDFFGKLYQEIAKMLGNPRERKRGCELIRRFKATLDTMIEDRQKHVLAAAKLDLGIIETALTQCLVREVKGNKDSVDVSSLPKATTKKIESQISNLEAAQKKVATEKSRILVDRHLKVLRDIM